MSVAIIINPRSGTSGPEAARQRAELASAILTKLGEAGETLITERRGHARDLAIAATERGASLVFAWGGDGTVNEVGSALADRPTALGIVPAGSGNGLARALQVARQPEQAIAEAMRAVPRAIDAGEFGGQLFFNAAGTGFDAHVAERLNHGGKRRGFIGYARATLSGLMTYEPRTYWIDSGASERRYRALFVAIANSPQFGNGAYIAPDARLDDGRLDLVIVEEHSRLRTIAAIPRLFTGGIRSVAGVSMVPVREVHVESDQPMTFHVDGETHHGGTTLDARIHPGALRVAVR